jgi:hypothetical protein
MRTPKQSLEGTVRVGSRRGCGKTVCTRGSNWALLGGPSTSPLDGDWNARGSDAQRPDG